VTAQENEGIKFENGLSWEQIIEKAKKENKYVFIDTYTTWCAPCKQMEKEIFPQKNVGDFFNKNFINVKYQIDRTKKDNDEIKKRYLDAKLIESTYKISLYPTYLFLNPDGKLVHEIKGGSNNSEEFIEKASAALNPATQYNLLKKEFENGNRDTTFLKQIISTATSTYDLGNAKRYIKAYLKSQTNLLTPQNIKYIATSLDSSKDIGYNIILNKPEEVLPIIGKQYREYILNSIAFDEDILPFLRVNGKKEISASGMMISYTGEINNKVDWEAIQSMLNSKYCSSASILMFNAKTTYYKWKSDWDNINKTLIEYTTQYEFVNEGVICNWLNYMVSFGKQEHFANAIPWAKFLLKVNEKSNCVKDYGILLYKAGEREEAVKVLTTYNTKIEKPMEDVSELINKMKLGSKLN
jgi:thioredoxin-related protein